VPAGRSRRYEQLARRAAAHERELAAKRERELQESEPNEDATHADHSNENAANEERESG
jgi:hypothetical protein